VHCRCCWHPRRRERHVVCAELLCPWDTHDAAVHRVVLHRAGWVLPSVPVHAPTYVVLVSYHTTTFETRNVT